MDLALTRILFTQNMAAMLAFYRDVLGLALLIDEPGFKEFDTGGCRLALHHGSSRRRATAKARLLVDRRRCRARHPKCPWR